MTEEEFWNILHSASVPKPVFYRLYYNDTGNPIIYSMEELSGNYIEVDQETYAIAPFNIRVVDKKIVYIKPTITVKKLQPSEIIGISCDVQDVCIVVRDDQPHTKWTIVNNEIN
jgi:hypothetical protein